jgi:hypothetical protein
MAFAEKTRKLTFTVEKPSQAQCPDAEELVILSKISHG